MCSSAQSVLDNSTSFPLVVSRAREELGGGMCFGKGRAGLALALQPNSGQHWGEGEGLGRGWEAAVSPRRWHLESQQTQPKARAREFSESVTLQP